MRVHILIASTPYPRWQSIFSLHELALHFQSSTPSQIVLETEWLIGTLDVHVGRYAGRTLAFLIDDFEFYLIFLAQYLLWILIHKGVMYEWLPLKPNALSDPMTRLQTSSSMNFHGLGPLMHYCTQRQKTSCLRRTSCQSVHIVMCASLPRNRMSCSWLLFRSHGLRRSMSWANKRLYSPPHGASSFHATIYFPVVWLPSVGFLFYTVWCGIRCIMT